MNQDSQLCQTYTWLHPTPLHTAPPPLRRSSPVGRVGSDDEENTFSIYFEGEEIQFTNWFEKLLFQHVPIGPNRNQEDLSMNRNSIEHLYNRWFPGTEAEHLWC